MMFFIWVELWLNINVIAENIDILGREEKVIMEYYCGNALRMRYLYL